MCCCAKDCVQCIVYFLNIILILTGIGLLISGIILLINGFAGSMSILVPGLPYFYVAILLLVAAVFILCIGCFGCMAAFKGDVCALIWYYVLVTIVVCLEASALVMTFANWRSGGFHPGVKDYVTSRALQSMKRFGTDGEDKFTNTWNDMQMKQECCGVNSQTDWTTYRGFEAGSPPDSCCEDYYVGCSKAIGGAALWEKGCGDYLVDETFRGLNFLGFVVLVFIIIQIILLLFVAILIFLHRFGNDPKNTCCGTGEYEQPRKIRPVEKSDSWRASRVYEPNSENDIRRDTQTDV